MSSSEAGSAARVATAHSYADRSLSSLSARLTQLLKYSAEYASLRARIQSLVLKTRHEIMVPLGPLAFQPGFLHHTNEFTVLLGDNIFVERSAHECEAIIERRREFVEAQITRVREQIDNIRNVSSTQKKMFGTGAKPAATPAAKPASSSAKTQPRSILDLDDADEFDDAPAPAAPAAAAASSSSSAVPAAASLADEDESGDPNAALDPALLGIRMRADGKLINEEGEEIVEIKEEYHSDDEEEQEEQKTSAASASSSSSVSAPAAASAEALQFPSSMLDKDFDQFWSDLEGMEQKEEAAAAASASASAAAAAPASVPSPAAAASTASASASADSLEPIPSPPLRPITSPADIFHHMQLARIKAGAERPPEPPKPAARKPAAAPAASAKAKPAAAASKPSVATSRSLDAAFDEYKQSPQYAADLREQEEAAARAEAQARRAIAAPAPAAAKATSTSAKKSVSSAKKSVSFAGNEFESEAAIRSAAAVAAQSRKPIIKAAPASQPPQPQQQSQPKSIARASAPTAATAPLTTAEGAAFTGEIQERSAAAPAAAPGRASTAAHSGPRPIAQPPRPMVRPMATAPAASAASASSSEPPAPEKKVSMFKAKRLGLNPDDI